MSAQQSFVPLHIHILVRTCGLHDLHSAKASYLQVESDPKKCIQNSKLLIGSYSFLIHAPASIYVLHSWTKAVFARSLRAHKQTTQTTFKQTLCTIETLFENPSCNDPESPAPISIASPASSIRSESESATARYHILQSLEQPEPEWCDISLCGWYDNMICQPGITIHKREACWEVQAPRSQSYRRLPRLLLYVPGLIRSVLKIFGICSKASCLDHRLRFCTSIFLGCLILVSIRRHQYFNNSDLQLRFWVEAVSEVSDVSPFSKVTWQEDVKWILSGQNHVSHVRLGIRKKGFDTALRSRLAFFPDLLHPEGTNIIFVASEEHKLRKSSNGSKEFQTFGASNSGIFQAYKTVPMVAPWSFSWQKLIICTKLPACLFKGGEVTTTSNARRLLLSNQNTWIKNVEALKEFVSQVFHMHRGSILLLTRFCFGSFSSSSSNFWNAVS